MNLVYITSVSIPSLSAQSKQILSNSKTMSNYFKEFKLISPSTNKNKLELDYPFWEKKDLIFKKGKFKYLEFAFRSIFFKIKESNYIYTRDILIALIFKIKKYTILYESHQKPKFFARTLW